MTGNLLTFSASLIFGVVSGALFLGYLTTMVTVRLMGVFQQEHYESGGFLKWYFKKSSITRRRISLLALSLCLLTALFNVCFSFLGHRAANLIALIPFMVLFGLYFYSEQKYALKVSPNFTPRLTRLGIADFILTTAVSCGLLFALAAISDAAGAEWFYLLRFVPAALVLLLCPFLLILSRYVMDLYEIPHGKRFIERAKTALKESPCIKVGITGSFGKTSVKNFAAAILSGKFRVIATPSSYNTPSGIARAVNEGGLDCDIFLAEMGARRVGDIRELCDMVCPTFGIVTGVGNQHLQTFGSLEAIRGEKGELVHSVQTAVLGASCTDMVGAEQVFRYGTEFAAENVVLHTDGTQFDLRLGEKTVPVRTQILGRQAAEDIALAAALALALGMTAEEIAAGIEKIQPVVHRLQQIRGESGVAILDDSYNSNVEGAKNALEVLRLFSGKLYVVTPGLVELGEIEEEENRALGQRLVGLNVILVGETLVRAVRDGYLEAGGDENTLRTVPTLAAAQNILAEELTGDDCVLFLNDLPDIY